MNMFGKISILSAGVIIVATGVMSDRMNSVSQARAVVVERVKPIELEDGRLIFPDMSGDEIQEFSAEQLFQLNRRLSSVQAMMIRTMGRSPFLDSDAANFMGALVQQDGVLLRSVAPSAPEAKN